MPMIRAGGFNGTAAITWVADAQMMTDKLKDGVP